MSQVNLHEITRQQQEQLAAMQAQIQALLAVQGGVGGEAGGSNMGSHMEVAKLAIFNGEAEKVGSFITACRLFVRNEDEGKHSRRTGAVGVVICAGRVGRCLERKHNGRIGGRESRI